MIRILLVDGRRLVHSHMKSLLNETETLQVTTEVEGGENVIRAAREFHPEVVLIALNMPNMGFETVARLLQYNPALKIIILSPYTHALVPVRLLDLGVAGYLSKHTSQKEMLQAIQVVSAGGRYIDSSIVKVINSFLATQNNLSPLLRLNQRELQILLMIVNGIKTGNIAQSLHLNEKTINAYMVNVLQKLGVETDAQAIRIVIESGLMDVDF